jgi:hypothetical protein
MLRFRARGFRRLVLVAIVGAGEAASLRAQPNSSLAVLGSPVISIDPATKSGDTLLYLTNLAAVPADVVLSAGPLVSSETGKVIASPAIFSLPDGSKAGPVFNDKVPADNRPLVLKVTFANVWEAGTSKAPLLNGSAEVGKLTVVNLRVPFDVHLEPESAGAAPISLLRNGKTTLILKNDDAMTYPLRWRFGLGGAAPLEGDLKLTPSGQATLEIPAQESWFRNWFSGLFRDEMRDGVLTLRYAPAGDTADPAAARSEIPIRAALAFWNDSTKAFWSSVLLLLMLTLGALTSFLLNHWVPNKLRLIALKERLGRLATKTRDLSTRIGSQLRVGLRVERRRLEEALSSGMTVSPDFADAAQAAEMCSQRLERRVDLLEQIDTLYHALGSAATARVAPTFCEQIRRKLDDSQERLTKNDPADEELQAAKVINAEAAALVQNREIDDATLEGLRTRFIDLWKDYGAGGTVSGAPFFQALQSRVPMLLTRCQAIATNPASNVTRETFLWLDTACAKLALIRDYVTATSPPVSGTPADVRQQALLDSLSQDSVEALEDSRLLVQQVKEMIFREDLEFEIRNQKVSIEMEPVAVYSYAPILFRIRFRRPALNRAAALQRLACVWDFGHDGLKERGWATCHFFPDTTADETILVTARFEDHLGQPIQNAQGKDVVVEEKIQVRPRSSRSRERLKVELLRMAAVLIAVVLGLLGGARTELAKADLVTGMVAVFVLGFSADAFKNLLAKK